MRDEMQEMVCAKCGADEEQGLAFAPDLRDRASMRVGVGGWECVCGSSGVNPVTRAAYLGAFDDDQREER